MSIIAAFAGTYCKEEPAIKEIVQRTGFKYITDADIASKASCLSGLSEGKILRAFHAKMPVFNQFTHEKELAVAYIKLALAKTLYEDNIFMNGFTSLLVPLSITEVLRIFIVADMKSRVSVACESGMSEREARKLLHKDDEDRTGWLKGILEKHHPMDFSLYDMVLPTDKMTPEEIGPLVAETMGRDIFLRSSSGKKAIDDFILASLIEAALIKEGYYAVTVEADDGKATLTIKNNVLMLRWLEKKLQSVAGNISGVKCVETKVGKQFYQSDIVRKFELVMPSKPLMVDDERQFVPKLSQKALLQRNRVYSRI
jgi:two-component system, OmpR family, response regulator CpxR